ncbi:MAG: OmpA family protein [Bacteroidota bacterium]
MRKNHLFILFLFGIQSYLHCQKENLGPLINTNASGEYAGRISSDGSKLFFVKSISSENPTMKFNDVYVWSCDLLNDSVVSKAKLMTYPFNMGSINCSVRYESVDGNLRILQGIYDENDKFLRDGYSYVTRTSEGWSKRKAINVKDYDLINQGPHVSMCMSPSANVMVLSFSENSSPSQQIYISKRIDDNNWTKPTKINVTKKGDFAPFVAADNESLYFTSDKRGGYGKEDIFVTKRLDDTWLNWSEPENIGPKFNSKKGEQCFSVSPSGKYAFMDVYTLKTSEDIVRIPLFDTKETKKDEIVPEVVKPNPVIIVEGVVRDAETMKTLGASLEYINLENKYVEGIARSSVVDGAYKVILPYGSNYSIGAKLQGYYSEDVNLDLSTVGEFTTIKRDILLRPIKADAIIRLNNIFFETGKAVLLPTSQNELDRLITILKENPVMVIEIRGHTDNDGGTEFNQTLSQNRAKSVVEYLISKGIDTKRLSSKGFGEKAPTSTNDTKEGKALNRRVEFKIISVK